MDRHSIRTYVTHTVGSDSKRVYVKAKCKKKEQRKEQKGHIQLYNLDHRAKRRNTKGRSDDVEGEASVSS